jgi:hypothetical protein
MRIPSFCRASFCVLLVGSICSSCLGQGQTVRVGVTPLNHAYPINATEGREHLVKALTAKKKPSNISQDFVALDATDQPGALQEASEKRCQFVLMPTQVSHMGTAAAGAPGFSVFRFEIQYKLIRASDSRVVAKASADSTGMVVIGGSNWTDIFTDAMQQVAGRIVHDVAKAASKLGVGK